MTVQAQVVENIAADEATLQWHRPAQPGIAGRACRRAGNQPAARARRQAAVPDPDPDGSPIPRRCDRCGQSRRRPQTDAQSAPTKIPRFRQRLHPPLGCARSWRWRSFHRRRRRGARRSPQTRPAALVPHSGRRARERPQHHRPVHGCLHPLHRQRVRAAGRRRRLSSAAR
jgi:hypothetical protein